MRLTALLFLLCFLGACGDSDNSDEDTTTPKLYSAEIRRTDYGIPHIKAANWGSLGYGYGFAYAQDNFCVTMREIVFATSRSAELMGETDGNTGTDFLFRELNGSKEDFKTNFVDPLPQDAKDLIAGFAAGMNRYLRDTGKANLAEGSAGCRDAAWVYEIDAVDLWMYLRRIGLAASSDQDLLRQAILDASGPTAAASGAAPMRARLAGGQIELLGRQLRAAAGRLVKTDGGSNAIALGRDATQSGVGMLLGNPHQPWAGSGRWYEVHLTIPGEYDVAGAALQGLPWVGIGFNSDLAWTHTVSYATRFTLYELTLNTDNPLQYEYDGAFRDIVPETVQIQVKLSDGTLETREHTFYRTHYGLVVNLKSVSSLLDGWPLLTGTLLVMRDANLETGARAVGQYIKMGQAHSIATFTDALKTIGVPVFHTLAADRAGDAFYGEVAVVPHVTKLQLVDCVHGVLGPLLAQSTNNALLTLDGSTPDCEWGSDADSPAGSNVYGYAARPKIETTGYVANSNNSYWLSDANHPLTGFPVVFGWMGSEGKQQFTRTSINHIMVAERLAGTDGFDPAPGFTLPSLQKLMYANRVYGAEIVLDDVLTICDDTAAAGSLSADQQRAIAACDVLRLWDRKVNLDSEGSQVFTEFWKELRTQRGNPYANVIDDAEFWSIDFDPEDPIHTPSGIDLTIDTNRSLVVDALSKAVQALDAANVALAAPLGDIQYLPRNDEKIPIHGGMESMGVFSQINVPLDSGGYYNISSGSSYIQTVTWDDSQCPVADTILTHSQSTDPASPHYGDQTELFSRKEWVRYPFCDADITARQIGETQTVEE